MKHFERLGTNKNAMCVTSIFVDNPIQANVFSKPKLALHEKWKPFESKVTWNDSHSHFILKIYL